MEHDENEHDKCAIRKDLSRSRWAGLGEEVWLLKESEKDAAKSGQEEGKKMVNTGGRKCGHAHLDWARRLAPRSPRVPLRTP